MAARPAASGGSIGTMASKRPERRAAASIADGSLVVASVTTPSWVVQAGVEGEEEVVQSLGRRTGALPDGQVEVLHDDERGREVVELPVELGDVDGHHANEKGWLKPASVRCKEHAGRGAVRTLCCSCELSLECFGK